MSSPIRILIADDHLIVREGLRLIMDTESSIELVGEAIRAATRGETLLQPEILKQILSSPPAQKSSPDGGIKTDLTEREVEVLRSVARGQTSKEIAYHLGITERTIKAHLTSIYNKFGVESRAAAVSEGMKRGILQ